MLSALQPDLLPQRSYAQALGDAERWAAKFAEPGDPPVMLACTYARVPLALDVFYRDFGPNPSRPVIMPGSRYGRTHSRIIFSWQRPSDLDEARKVFARYVRFTKLTALSAEEFRSSTWRAVAKLRTRYHFRADILEEWTPLFRFGQLVIGGRKTDDLTAGQVDHIRALRKIDLKASKLARRLVRHG